MSDADAHAPEFRAEMGVDRTQAVVPGRAAPDLHLDLERGEIELVMKDRQRVQVELIEMQGLLNRVAAVVHECLRLQQQHALPADTAFRDQAAELLLPWAKTVH